MDTVLKYLNMNSIELMAQYRAGDSALLDMEQRWRHGGYITPEEISIMEIVASNYIPSNFSKHEPNMTDITPYYVGEVIQGVVVDEDDNVRREGCHIPMSHEMMQEFLNWRSMAGKR